MQPGNEPVHEHIHIDVVTEAFDTLPENMQEVLRAVYFELVPYSELGDRLGCSKTQAWRKAKAALAELSDRIGADPILLERYAVISTWDDAAWQIVQSYDRTIGRPALRDTINYCARRLAETVRNHREPQATLFTTIACEAIAELKYRNLWQPEAFHALLCAKQADYGHDNINAFGIVGVAVRINDKVARLNNLADRSPMNESALDTWLDLIGYSVIAEMLTNGTFQLELAA